MKNIRKILLVLLSIALVFLVFMFWYQNEYAMDHVQEYEVNSPRENSKLLLATQGSELKMRLLPPLWIIIKRSRYI